MRRKKLKLGARPGEYALLFPSHLSIKMTSPADSMNHLPANIIDLTDINNNINSQTTSDNQNTMDFRIPVAIIIFDNDGQISYRAYSPTTWQEEGEAEIQYGQFLARIYQRLTYNPLEPMNTGTPFGVMKEVHTRLHHSPLAHREGSACYFTTYIHPHTPYKPVHRASPIFFNDHQSPNSYSAAVGTSAPEALELFHSACPHEFV
jgi:hypothetical protein